MTLDQLIAQATVLQTAGYGGCQVRVQVEYSHDDRDSYASIQTRVRAIYMADATIHIEAEDHQE